MRIHRHQVPATHAINLSEYDESDTGPFHVSSYCVQPNTNRVDVDGYVAAVPVPYTGHSYDGDVLYEANREAFDSMIDDDNRDWVVTTTYGYYVIIDSETPVDLLEAVAALTDYPILDEDIHSRLDMEDEERCWDEWGRNDFGKAIDLAGPYEDTEDTVTASGYDWSDWLDQLYWAHEAQRGEGSGSSADRVFAVEAIADDWVAGGAWIDPNRFESGAKHAAQLRSEKRAQNCRVWRVVSEMCSVLSELA